MIFRQNKVSKMYEFCILENEQNAATVSTLSIVFTCTSEGVMQHCSLFIKQKCKTFFGSSFSNMKNYIFNFKWTKRAILRCHLSKLSTYFFCFLFLLFCLL